MTTADLASIEVLKGPADAPPEVGTAYIDPALASVWGQRSHWRQPWRSYQETVPAEHALDAIGINMNVIAAHQADHTARLLAYCGVKRARIEVSWNSYLYNEPTVLATGPKATTEAKLKALAKYDIRPLILLNGNHGAPCPNKALAVEVTAEAAKGATTVKINPKDLGSVVVGKTGFTEAGIMARCLVTAKAEDGTLTVSRPLSTAIAKGAVTMATLLYTPFYHPLKADGSPQPLFEPTMAGWLVYAKAACTLATGIVGSDEFDIEVWNELSFGSNFLYIKNYYEPNEIDAIKGSPTDEILARTIAMVRNPANGFPSAGVGNGFANQTPFPAGSTSPVGLTAIDKHPYKGLRSFPPGAVDGSRPLNGLGQPAGTKEGGNWKEDFTPTYKTFFPEDSLTDLQQESLIHDLSTTPSKINSALHGRTTHPPGGDPPEMWVTEVNISDPPLAGVLFPGEVSAADARRIESKAILRYLSSFLAKGYSALHLFACIGAGGTKGLIDTAFYSAITGAPTTYPGDNAGGETMAALRRFVLSMAGATAIPVPRDIDISIITDYAKNVQFKGNGTPQYPDLTNADCLALFPFQVTAKKFVVPSYVMTRNIMAVHGEDPGATRFDMPSEKFRLKFEGLVGTGATATATDPLTNTSVPVSVKSASGSQITVEFEVTDSPRLLTIQEA